MDCILPSKQPIVKIGTSGYSYPWNKGKPTPFAWYLAQGFKTVEINASFHRFPMKSWIKAWSIAPKDFDFAIKVHRSITHYARLQGKALDLFNRFSDTLQNVEEKISFWLFQMPESFAADQENIETVSNFFKSAKLGNKAVIEFRHKSWWKHVREIEQLNAIFCSVDAPKLPREIISTSDTVYLRLHGREEWYSWIYTEEELKGIAKEILETKAKEKYIFLNNDHGMIPNSKFLMQALKI
jgi:uncharacterized protein YecE (DUF72 family)